MNRSTFFVCAAVLLGIAGVPLASAQQSITVYSGNGQLICNQCGSAFQIAGVNTVLLQQFDPLYVKVTDSAGNPVSGATVYWSVTSGASYLVQPASLQTQTDSSGLSYEPFTAVPPNNFTGQGPGQAVAPVQSTVTATLANNSFVNFTLSQTIKPASGPFRVRVDYSNAPQSQQTLSGSAGSSGQPFSVVVLNYGSTTGISSAVGMAGVSVRLLNYATGGANPTATVQCAQGSGADPGSVLTDSTGTATCTPILNGSGSGQFIILVGGVSLSGRTNADGTPIPQQPPFVGVPPNNDPTQPQPTWGGFDNTSWIVNLQVTAPTVGSVQVVSGNNQQANAGSALSAPLKGSVTDSTGAAIAGQAVTWTVTPAGAATLSSTGNTTDSNGQVSTNVTLAATASGTVTVTLTATGTGKSVNFTITANQPSQLSGITKLSGDNQTALVSAAFANPLVVQLTVTSGTAAGKTVTWAVSPAAAATLSAFSTATNGSGQAQITVTAGATAGAVTVTATAGTYSASFSLTISPPGPSLTASGFVNGADFQAGSISPCSIATIIAPGLAPGISGTVLGYNLVGFLDYTVANVSVKVGGADAPIYNVANLSSGEQQVTFQVPCTVTPGSSVPVTVAVGSGSATLNVKVLPASPGVFQEQSTVTVAGWPAPLPLAVIVKRDGTLVSPTNPARVGETVIAYVTGLGPTNPPVATNSLPAFGVTSSVTGTVVVGVNNAGVPVTFAQLSQDLLGVYLVAFTVPPLPSGSNGNLVFSIGLIPPVASVPAGFPSIYYSNPAAIYIQ